MIFNVHVRIFCLQVDAPLTSTVPLVGENAGIAWQVKVTSPNNGLVQLLPEATQLALMLYHHGKIYGLVITIKQSSILVVISKVAGGLPSLIRFCFI